MLPAWLTDTVTPDLDRALHYTGLWGLDGLELRTVGRERVPHANERKLRARLDEHELAVAALVPGLFEGPMSDGAARLNELALLAETIAFAGRVGGRVVVASAFAAEPDFDRAAAADLLRRAGDDAGRAGVTLALLPESDGQHPTATALAALIDAADHPAVGAAWAPADALRAGESPEAGLAALGRRVAHVRVRDGHAGPGGAWADAVVGEGAVGWPAVLRGLAAQGYTGALSLEVHPAGDLPAPKAGLRSATFLVREARAAARAAGRS